MDKNINIDAKLADLLAAGMNPDDIYKAAVTAYNQKQAEEQEKRKKEEQEKRERETKLLNRRRADVITALLNYMIVLDPELAGTATPEVARILETAIKETEDELKDIIKLSSKVSEAKKTKGENRAGTGTEPKKKCSKCGSESSADVILNMFLKELGVV